jgi:hypothetical protein
MNHSRRALVRTARPTDYQVGCQLRNHRPGRQPVAGREVISAWLADNAPPCRPCSRRPRRPGWANIGYTYGTYELKDAAAENDAYLRVWTRDGAGKWFVVADVTQPAR